MTQSKEPNPYKKVWNSAEDHEAELLESVKNCTMFVPTWEVLGHRYIGHSKSLLVKAREQESRAAGRKVFQDAMFYRNMAEKAFEEHRRVLRLSR